ncbi:hypothetical protein [Aeromicrobium massiliense]|uniref:hypothetical protein n=1 Tax=Aeromicrobium massiliense TaxID=1464554 RepID=UPI00057826CF|nr:hypothetical protein [Aeromicrobium massiliense]
MSSATVLTADRFRAWPRGVPPLVLVLGPPLTLVLDLVLTWDDSMLIPADELTAWWYVPMALVTGATFVGVLAGWWAPRLAAVSAAVGIFASAWVVSVLWVAVLAVDVWTRTRQRQAVAAWPQDSLGPPAPPMFRPPALVRWGAAAGATLALLACVLVATWWWGARAGVAEMQERAVPRVAAVLEQDTWDDSLLAEVDGESYWFYVEDASEHPVGEAFPVLVDPLGEHRPITSVDADSDAASLLADAAGGLLGVAVLVGLVPSLRWRRLRTLLLEPTAPLAADVGLGATTAVHAVGAPAGARPLVALPFPVVVARGPHGWWWERTQPQGTVPAAVWGLRDTASMCVVQLLGGDTIVHLGPARGPLRPAVRTTLGRRRDVTSERPAPSVPAPRGEGPSSATPWR